jgi:deoxyribodipyrimidine photo-lyase
MRTVVWFRGKDLRLADHAPLNDAIEKGEVIPLFVLDPYFFAVERVQQHPHRIQFLLDGLRELQEAIAQRGSKLVVVEGRSVDVVPKVVRQWKADRVVAHRWVEPFGRERDARIAQHVKLELFEGETLVPPGALRTSSGQAFKVFTPFARAWHRAAVQSRPVPAPERLPALPVQARSAPLPSFARNVSLQHGGEKAAHARLDAFLKHARRYATDRDRLDLDGTSRLSADLKFGTLSARTVWWRAKAYPKFVSELVWREFAYSTLWDFPHVLERPFREAWNGFPWRRDDEAWAAWCEGRTGYAVVDAAARQLLAEGFVPNRARMIAASFLTKHLLLDYRLGEAHYLKWLTDGDWANNNLNWQWSAGCGVDAQPWFRVFNPLTQAEKFDPGGKWLERWAPRPSPTPIVEHASARQRFLEVAKKALRPPGR